MFCWVCVLGRLRYWLEAMCWRCDRCGWLTMPDEAEFRRVS